MEFGTKNAVHRAFQRWVKAEAFEKMLHDMKNWSAEKRLQAFRILF